MIRVLYQDDSLIICEKPVGVSSESPGLPDLLREQEGCAVFPVHRLDQTTGGVCVLAKSPSVCAGVQRLFQQDLVIKEYLAMGASKGCAAVSPAQQELEAGLKAMNSAIAALQKALASGKGINPASAALRSAVDALESVVDDAVWPLPKYREMLFIY